VKTSRLTIAAGSLFCLLTAVSAQTTPSDATLTCHGKAAEGRHFGGPSLFSEKTTATSTDDLRNIITNGKGHMPKYAGKLTSEEIDMLVRQIKGGKSKP
jgi:hypothetical protein